MDILIAGGGGFIAGHLANYLKEMGHTVVGVDIKPIDDWWQLLGYDRIETCFDLRDGCELRWRELARRPWDYVFNLAADMGGMGYIHNHRVECMQSAMININLLKFLHYGRYFYASSACVYPDHGTQMLKEEMVWDAGQPEPGYGLEKLFSEQYTVEHKQWTARFHNVFGPQGSWNDGREKAPAALCRKVAMATESNPHVQVWGDGTAVRSFLYVADCVQGIWKLVNSDAARGVPLNIGSSVMVTIEDLLWIIADIADKPWVRPAFVHDKPVGVHGRCSNNERVTELTDWQEKTSLRDGLIDTYRWISDSIG